MQSALLSNRSGQPTKRTALIDFGASIYTVDVTAGILDCLVIVVSIAFGQAAYGFVVKTPSIDVAIASGIGIIACITHVVMARRLGLYRLQALIAPTRYIRRSLVVSSTVCLTLVLILFLFKTGERFSRAGFLIFLLAEAVGLVMLRLALGAMLRDMLARKAIAGRPVVVIADAAEVGHFTERSLLFHFGQQEVGRIVLGPEDQDGDRIAQAIELANRCGAEAFNLMVNWSNAPRLQSLRQALRVSPLNAYLLPDRKIRAVLERDEFMSAVRRTRVLLQRAPLNAGALAAKRVFDLSIALLGLLLLMPLLTMVAIAIKLDSPGPVIFRQLRKGFNQQPFVIYKFRSMTVQENGPAIRQASRRDGRVTRVGRFLRRSSIDELPQLLNVIKGSMSLVGPRPHAIAHDDHYEQRIDKYRLRHHVKPGITGWAQVNGIRGETSQIEDMQVRIEHDVWYVNNWSPLLDLVILMRTCLTVLGHDAY